MFIEQRRWHASTGWSPAGSNRSARLVLIFGSRDELASGEALDGLQAEYPSALLFGCSTAGEIAGNEVLDGSVTATAVEFDSTFIHSAEVNIGEFPSSCQAGHALGQLLPAGDLRSVFVLSDGLHVNGSDLVRGLTEALPPDVPITGGLSGDGSRFEKTLVINGPVIRTGVVAAIGFYGPALRVGCGTLGGWDPFGPERRITRSEANVLFELDGQPALGLYRRYLGEHASRLPSSGLLFPLAIRHPGSQTTLVRTILSVSEEDGSLTFAGDVPEGHLARLMKANFDRLVDGAAGAAASSVRTSGANPQLALLISCVGRKLVLGQRIEDEIEAVRDVVGPRAVLSGFYSYGEISPFASGGRCELHNQTMSVTTLSEV